MRTLASLVIWLFIGVALLFLYAPLVPPAINSFGGTGGRGLFANYAAILEDPRLMRAIGVSALSGAAVAVVTPLIALIAAQAVRVFRIPRLVIGVILIPLFVPGVSMGVATALFFQLLGIGPSLFTIVAVQVLWALPFAFLIILTAMANFDQVYLEAAYMSGANPVAAFREVELPQIWPGILGGAIFSLILSFNETVRTAVVQGGQNTVQTYLWAQYQQVGLSPNLYALMTAIILATLGLIAGLAILDRRLARASK
jgi:putative spermidine/putrescine transport system permease protein/spermidine/putrescine transport system permease protein